MKNRCVHPSFLFQQREVHNFLTATRVYVAQYREELRLTRESIRVHPGPDPEKDRQDLIEQARSVNQIEAMIEIAKAIYEKQVGVAIQQAVQEMRAHGDPMLQELADALEAGCYDGLAL